MVDKTYDSECCGTCLYHKRDYKTGDWVCTNPYSEAYGLETDYEDVCDEHENRRRNQR